jgi:HAD superfamily hydrolase (TIGR01509 family)
MIPLRALLFDCDGVIADTERDGHRVAFNRAFAQLGLGVEWDVARYGELLRIAGGKERMRHYFDAHGWPAAEPDRDALIKKLHLLKTDLFMALVESGAMPLRSGIARLVDAADAAGLRLAVCSTSHERAVSGVVERLLGPRRAPKFSGIFAGDIVPHKKPAPDIYLLAARRLGVAPAECVVVEDSRNGLLAATAAGMACLVTTSAYTADEDFTGAARVVPELGDPPAPHVTLDDLRALAETAAAR